MQYNQGHSVARPQPPAPYAVFVYLWQSVWACRGEALCEDWSVANMILDIRFVMLYALCA